MAKIKEEDIDALREKADIVELVSGYTPLKKSGANTFKGLCPFHSEKTPSFSVNSGTGLFHCLSGETGVITWAGTFPIEKLAGETHRLLSKRPGGQPFWVDAEIKSFGVQQLYEIKLSRNRRKKSIFATDGHRWFVRGGKRQPLKEKVTAKLVAGDSLPSVFARARAGLPVPPSPLGIAHGFTFGDG
ncbi:MAG TPA: CHC2 zinc finger domain-containing protein, partial [Actinomycetota bacterium]|nr:CHC2 zinc finger domain-containing protein [Actinomycetota bacterium]